MRPRPDAATEVKVGPSVNTFEPDLEGAHRFLELLGPGEVFTFQTFPDKKDASSGFKPTRVLHGTLDEHAETLMSLNRKGAGIFVMVNEGNGQILEGKNTCRTAENVVRVRAAFVDLDGAPLKPVIQSKVAPDIVVESSLGRWHTYWLLDECPLNEFKPTQIALAQAFGGDPKVTDLCRVMRLPGFWHQKHEPFMSRIVDLSELKGE